jgi:hypothetical protein
MTVDTMRDSVLRALSDGNGILRLEPAWVARDFLPPGRRFGLPDDAYDLGIRGAICERWLASTTRADNQVGPANEGLSYLALDSQDRITLAEAVAADPALLIGPEYAAAHEGLGRLAKIFDYSTRLPLHLHQRSEHAALVGRRPKEEAYYFPPGAEMGPHPECFLGVHPSVAQEGNHALLLPHLQDWNSDLILQYSVAFLQVSEHGFHVPAGVLHAPGSALTIELQEDSDVFAMLQALNAGKIISKELLWKDVRTSDRETKGEHFILELIDWETNADPYFYDNHHLSPQLIEESRQEGGEEYWIYYNTTKFSGKKLVVRPGCSYLTKDAGVYNVLVWSGSGSYGELAVQGGDPALDEVLVTHERAVGGVEVRNTGQDDLLIIKFFGPDVNPDVPMIDRRESG